MAAKKEEEMKTVIGIYGDLLYRTAYVLLGNPHDVQDVLQEVLLKYMEKAPDFHEEAHRKAWLLKVTANRHIGTAGSFKNNYLFTVKMEDRPLAALCGRLSDKRNLPHDRPDGKCGKKTTAKRQGSIETTTDRMRGII